MATICEADTKTCREGYEEYVARGAEKSALSEHSDTSFEQAELASPINNPQIISALIQKARFLAAVLKIRQLRVIASELFEIVSVDFEVDPEIPGTEYFVINVSAAGDLEEISQRQTEWYRRTYTTLKDCSEFVRLSIDVSE